MKVTTSCVSAPSWSPTAPRIAAVSTARRADCAPLAFSAASKYATSCAHARGALATLPCSAGTRWADLLGERRGRRQMQTWRRRVLSSRTRRRRVSSMPADAKPYCCSTDAQTVIAPATTNTLHHFFTCRRAWHGCRKRPGTRCHVRHVSAPSTHRSDGSPRSAEGSACIRKLHMGLLGLQGAAAIRSELVSAMRSTSLFIAVAHEASVIRSYCHAHLSSGSAGTSALMHGTPQQPHVKETNRAIPGIQYGAGQACVPPGPCMHSQ
jgi:hypothetical protein